MNLYSILLTTYIQMIIDHQVSFIHATPNGDSLIAYMARVSNPANQDNHSTAPRLIKYLLDHNHYSPFEMVSMCLEINTTRSVAQQIIRHRSFSFQEFSQRYAVVNGAAVPNLRSQDTKNRQNSIDNLDPLQVHGFSYEIEQLYDQSFELYQRMLDNGVAKECARDVLPLSSRTKLYMHGTLRSWYHYCQLRCDNGTQLEHKYIADQCKEQISLHFPACYEAMWSEETA